MSSTTAPTTCATCGLDPVKEKNQVLIFGIIILVILLIIVVIFWFTDKHAGKYVKWGSLGLFVLTAIAFTITILVLNGQIGTRECDICNPVKNENCAKDLFCAGDARCHKGAHGGGKGAECTDSGKCDFGLTCQLQTDKKRRCENPPAPSPF